MARTFETLQEALYELSKLVPKDTDKIEAAPKEAGDSGPVVNATWQDVRRDLSDLPRGERYLIRRKGEGRGKKPKGVCNYIAVCICKENVMSIQGMSPSLLESARALDAERWTIMQMKEDVLKFKEEALNGIQVLQKQTMILIGDSIQHANSAGASASLIAELTKAQAELLDELSEAKASNNTSMGIMHIINRIISAIQMRKINSWEELRKIPELKKDLEEFHRWKDERDAPPPGDE